jgi:hypothetical protein
VTPTPGRRLACALVLMVGLPACGGGGNSAPNPVPTATPTPAPTTTVLFDAPWPPLEQFGYAFGDFPIPNSGTVRATIDWTFPTNHVLFFIFSGGTCTDFDAFLTTGAAPGCTLLGQHTARGVKPGVISFEITAPQNGRLLLWNLGPTNESGIVQITLTR